MNASTPKLRIQDNKVEKINKSVTKKLYRNQRPEKSLHEQLFPSCFATLIAAFHGIFMIFPAVLVGLMSGIGAAFEVGMKKALEVYKER